MTSLHAVRRAALGACAAALLVVTSATGAAVAGGSDAPATSQTPALDSSTVFAFTSPARPDMVTLIGTSWPMQEPHGGSVFYPFAAGVAYDINVDQDGDGRPELVYRYVFSTQRLNGGNTFLYDNGQVTSLDDSNLLLRQTYDLTEISTDAKGRQRSTTLLTGAPVAPSDTGPATMPNYSSLADQAVTPVPTGGSSYAGAAADPSFADQRVYDILYGGNLSEVGQNTYKGYNTNAIALELPKTALALGGSSTRNPVIGVWTSTAALGRQVSRVGNPLINDLVTAYDTKDPFNAAQPSGDGALVGGRVSNPELPLLIQAIYGIPAPRAPRDDLTELWLTGICGTCGPIATDLNAQRVNADVPAGRARPADELRLNMSVPVTANPNRLGLLGGDLQGYPNGRRLTDDVTDITIQSFEGAFYRGLPPVIVAPLAGGDGVTAPGAPPRLAFPYLALPYDDATNTAGSRAGADPQHVDITTSAASGADVHGGDGPGQPVLLAIIAVLAVALLRRPGAGVLRLVRRGR